MIDVTVITPTFRRPESLRAAILSVLAQTGVSVEMIVVDDSIEGSARPVVASIGDPRVRYEKMPKPTGGNPALVRNTGISKASGRYVHFLDDDDLVVEGAYQAMVAALDARPRTGVAFGQIEPFGDNPGALARERAYFASATRRARFSQRLRGTRRLMAANILFQGTVLVCSACLIRRDCLLLTDGFDPKTRIVEDVDFYLRAIRRFDCVFLDQPVLRYGVGHTSLMHNAENERVVENSYKQIYENYRKGFGAAEMLALKILMRTVFRGRFFNAAA